MQQAARAYGNSSSGSMTSIRLGTVLLRRRHGSGRGAAALAVRQAEGEALIAGATKLDVAAGSWKQARRSTEIASA
jgi:hypothetical protein